MTASPALGRWLLRTTAGLSLVAAALHAGAADEHLREWWGYGAFFVAASVAQGAYGLLLFAMPERPRWEASRWKAFRRHLYGWGLAGTLAVIALYVVTRTVGIPLFGPEAGTVEPVGAFDLATKAVELLMAICLAVLFVRVGREGDGAEAASRIQATWTNR